MLAEPKEANTRQDLAQFYEAVLWMYSTSGSGSTLCVHSHQMTHQAKQVTSAFFIRRNRETESVESSLTIPVTFCLRSITHSCPIMNAFTIIITTRMHAARTNPNSITEGERPHIRIRQGGNPTQRKLTDLCPSISAKDGLEF